MIPISFLRHLPHYLLLLILLTSCITPESPTINDSFSQEELTELQMLASLVGTEFSPNLVLSKLELHETKRIVYITLMLPTASLYLPTPTEQGIFKQMAQRSILKVVCSEAFSKKLISNGGRITYIFIKLDYSELFRLSYTQDDCTPSSD